MNEQPNPLERVSALSGSDTTELEQRIAAIADLWSEQLRRGQEPDLSALDEQDLELKPLLRPMLESIRAMCDIGKQSGLTLSGQSDPAADSFRPSHKREIIAGRCLGEYVLKEEIGRGGMGVVYRAWHESLQRTVALKVLPPNTFASTKLEKRFLREARSAARLHHTNIVPIFDVGSEFGFHYYAMQCIEGQSLEKVIEGVRQSRAAESPETIMKESRTRADTTSLASSMLSDEFAPVPKADAKPDQHGDLHQPHGCPFRRCIARIGIQIADALQYAHDHGIFHRDIKPSNLLLDVYGNAWVADFGLAKMDDQEDLTQTGDVLGTLRYMAPEQLAGTSDARSDVYSLGLTLYECLALRPAFGETNRKLLIGQVVSSTPASLRQIDPSIEPDLATIISKAIEREPKRRYESAAELRDDLRRFLDDLPIRARPISSIGRIVRWSRREPSTAALVVLLAVMGLASPFLLGYFGHLVHQSRIAKNNAEDQLYQSLRSAANAKRFSGRSGQQFDTLDALRSAVALRGEHRLATEDVDEMRRDAIAALSLPDLHPRITWSIDSLGKLSLIHFSPDLAYYCAPTDQRLVIRRCSDNFEESRLPIGGVCERARFSPDGRLISLTDWHGNDGTVRVLDWRTGELVYRIEHPTTMFACDFSPDGSMIAVGHVDSTVTFHDLASKRQLHSIAVASAPIAIRFDSAGRRVAISCESAFCTEIWQTQTFEKLRVFQFDSEVFNVAWSPSDRFLAIVQGFVIHLFDLESENADPLQTLEGHAWVVAEIVFHPNGRLLYSHSWREGKTRVWDVFTGQKWLESNGFVSAINRAGSQLAYRKTDQVGIWDVDTGEVSVWPPILLPYTPRVMACDYSDDGQWLAAASDEGVHIWNTTTWQVVARYSTAQVLSVMFEADDSRLLIGHSAGLESLAFRREDGQLQLESPISIKVPDGLTPYQIAASADGANVLVDLVSMPNTWATGRVLLLERNREKSKIIEGPRQLRCLSVRPDGRFMAAGTWQGEGARVWDLKTGSLVADLPTEGTTIVAFSPDNRWLTTVSINQLCTWDTDTWQPRFTHDFAMVIGAMAYSPDGKTLAIASSGTPLKMIRASDGQLLTTLESNSDPPYVASLHFRPDGEQLAVSCATDGLRVWQLGEMRSRLRQIGLAWEE